MQSGPLDCSGPSQLWDNLRQSYSRHYYIWFDSGNHQRYHSSGSYYPQLACDFTEPGIVYDYHQWLYRILGKQALYAIARNQFLGSNACRYHHRTGKLSGKCHIGGSQIMSVYNYITIGSVLLMVLLILVQTRGASLGAGLGSSGEINTVRRGTDKTIFQLTIVTAIVFAASLILGVVS
jgi:preprotein translocase subunit SecG